MIPGRPPRLENEYYLSEEIEMVGLKNMARSKAS